MKARSLSIGLLAATLAGCTGYATQDAPSDYPKAERIGTVGRDPLYVFNDRENGAVCHVITRGGGAAAISCMPSDYDR